MVESGHGESPRSSQVAALGVVMTETAVLVIAIACFAGRFILAWLWSRASAHTVRLEPEKRAAALDGVVGELTKQAEALKQDEKWLQTRVEHEQALRAAAEKEAQGERGSRH